jgi:hypothetical protein
MILSSKWYLFFLLYTYANDHALNTRGCTIMSNRGLWCYRFWTFEIWCQSFSLFWRILGLTRPGFSHWGQRLLESVAYKLCLMPKLWMHGHLPPWYQYAFIRYAEVYVRVIRSCNAFSCPYMVCTLMIRHLVETQLFTVRILDPWNVFFIFSVRLHDVH